MAGGWPNRCDKWQVMIANKKAAQNLTSEAAFTKPNLHCYFTALHHFTSSFGCAARLLLAHPTCAVIGMAVLL